MKKRTLLALLLSLAGSGAQPLVKEVHWREACEGATIQVASEGGQPVGARALAFHFAKVIEWTIHFLDGVPATAEYRESDRGRIAEGERAGELSHVNTLVRLRTFKSREGRFQIEDQAMARELEDILAKVKGPGIASE